MWVIAVVTVSSGRVMKIEAVSGIMLTLLFTSMLLASLGISETLANPTVRVYVKMPDGYIPGTNASTLDVEVWIDSPPEWTGTVNGIVGWSMYVHVDPEVLTPLDVDGARPGYWLYDFCGIPHIQPDLLPVQKNASDFIDIAEFIQGWEIIMVGAGGSGKLCTLTFAVLSETAYTKIDVYNAYYYTTAGGTEGQVPVDVVDDGHYNEPEDPAPELTIEGVLLPYLPYVYHIFIYPNPDPYFTYKINVIVANEGTADAGSFNVSFSAYWEEEEVPEVWQKKTIPSLQQGINKTVAFNFYPEEHGNYTLIIMADCDNDVAELDETNNTKIMLSRSTIGGDVDGDGDVDSFDFYFFSGKYGQGWPFPPYPTADLDWDGDVDSFDFYLIAGKYGQSVF